MTNETTALAEQQDNTEARRKLALLKAVGLDRVPPEQRELALAIAKRYDLDLMLQAPGAGRRKAVRHPRCAASHRAPFRASSTASR